MQKTIPMIVLAMLWPKFKYKALFIPLLLLFAGTTAAQEQPGGDLVSGTVTTATGKPIPGATVRIKANGAGAITNKDGNFSIKTTLTSGVLQFSFISYKTIEAAFNESNHGNLKIVLQEDAASLQEVNVVSTGYQTLPKERATGSFVLIDSALLNRKVSTNILDRLDGVTSGLIFNRNIQTGNSSTISVRGRSTIFANPNPLIVLDNFPYEGDISNINPNDIETVTVLKDAAAASIWGVRAGNGVIVITSKKGKNNTGPTLSFNTNVTIGDKPDLFYKPQLSSAQYIDVEQFLFNKGAYNAAINTGYTVLSPAVEIFLKGRNKTITASDSSALIDALKGNDVRNDINKYLTRKSVYQQYQLSINGGSSNNQYYISAGYDQNQANAITNSYNRVTLNARNTYQLLKNKLEWTTGILFTNSNQQSNTNNYIPLSPYERIADENGIALPTVKGLRMLYADTAGRGRLLDWHYLPINENYSNATIGSIDYRLNTDLTYKISKPLKITAYYLYQKGITDNVTTNTASSYYTRNLINTYSQINQTTGEVTYAIPPGDILDKGNSYYKMNTGRLQLNFNQNFGEFHELSALAGFEISEYSSFGDNFRLYGYDPLTASNSNQAINYVLDNPQYYGNGSGQIPTGTSTAGTLDRNRSYYANASYAYKHQYVVSASARWDESNIFGVKTNQKGVPLWSAGLSWNVSNADFFKVQWLSLLKLRATYGYNGNTDKSTTAYLTSSGGSLNGFHNPDLLILNPPNPSLRWEKIGVTNIGLDFNLSNNIFAGSIEYYQKNSTDLIANSPVAPQTGFRQFKGNTADMATTGMDITLRARIINTAFSWNTNLLFSYVKDKVTNYKVKQGSNQNIVTGNYNNPLEGYSYFSIFSFPYAGLDTLGNPRGYLNGAVSNNYSSILSSTDASNLKFNGSGVPVYFGSLLNNFNYKNFDLSVNLVYKLGYYFRRASLDYTALFVGGYQQPDYDLRWQKKGDEQNTIVPALNYPSNTLRNTFYRNSDVLIEPADHIRLQDIRLGYTLNNNQKRNLPFKMIQFYIYANSLGVIWRANHLGLDPDSPSSAPTPRSISFGLKATL